LRLKLFNRKGRKEIHKDRREGRCPFPPLMVKVCHFLPAGV
jgi:hypothetical protein